MVRESPAQSPQSLKQPYPAPKGEGRRAHLENESSQDRAFIAGLAGFVGLGPVIAFGS